jgi:hypothetical protein
MSFGPAMTALSPLRRAFVIAWNNSGQRNASDAARAAGYKDGPGLSVTAHVVLHDPLVQKAIQEDMRTRLVAGLGTAWARIDDIASNPQHPKQFDALKAQINHGGMVEKTKVEHEHSIAPTLEEKLDRLIRLRGRENVDPELLQIVDAEYTVVDDEPEQW